MTRPLPDVDSITNHLDAIRVVADLSASPMSVVSGSGALLLVNDPYCQLVGRSREELEASGLRGITHPSDYERDRGAMEALADGRLAHYTTEKRYIRPDGAVIWGIVTATPVRAGDTIIGSFSVIQDITSRKEAEEALQESEDRLRRLAEGATDFVVFRYRFDPEPGFEYVSPGARSLTGYSPEEFYADPTLTYRVLHPDDIHAVEQMRDPGNKDFGPHPLRVRHRDGRLRHTQQRIAPITDEAGRRLGFEAILIDITARVEAEQQVASRERRFRSLVQKSSDMILIADADGTLTGATPSVERVLGYSPAEVIGRPRTDFFHPDDVKSAADGFALGTQHPGASTTVEFRVRDADGQWRWLECTTTNLLSDPDVQGVVLNARDVTERRQLLVELQRRADYDPLTGLINWRRFMEVLAERTEGGASERPLGVLVLGLNRFGAVNDTLGYQFGDRLLQVVAERLDQWAGADVVVARGGGKRFALLCDTIGHESLVETTEAVLELFEAPFDVEGQSVQIDATAGAALYPSDGGDPELLLRRAEVARRRARTTGASFARYAAGLVAPGAGQIRFLGQLREAIGGGQLLLHYQPKVDVTTHVVHGVEALVRWQHPLEGWVQPAQFIPLAEESGLIRPLTKWVLAAALDHARQWRRAGLHLPAAVNITSRNLQDHQFVDTVAAALAEHGARPSDLCLEITERSVMTDPVAATDTCRRLADLGVRLSLDDFGTGQSALAYLVSLPIDEIKIDRAFVVALRDKPEARAIVRAIVALATDLGKDVIAEGVEDPATAELLVSLGCSRMQGYLYSRPVPVEAVAPWLNRGSWNVAQPPGQ